MYQIDNKDLPVIDYSMQTNKLLSVALWIKGPLKMLIFKKKKITQKINIAFFVMDVCYVLLLTVPGVLSSCKLPP